MVDEKRIQELIATNRKQIKEHKEMIERLEKNIEYYEQELEKAKTTK